MAPRPCLRCRERRAVLKRPRTGEQVCRECFFYLFEEEVHQIIVTCNDGDGMFKRGEKVAIAASGGKDSTVLAHVMKSLNVRHDYGLDLFLLSIDEGITGYRDDSLETVKQNQIDYGLPLKILSYAELYRGWTMDRIVGKIGKKGNCTFCGVFRRQALDRGAAQLAVDHIVTGHNADDVAETVLMNILRGDIARLERSAAITTMGMEDNSIEQDEDDGCGSSDPFAQSGFKIKRSKPFKYTFEKEIVLYAYFKKLVYFSTECIYSPNAYRGYARTYLKQLEYIRSQAILDIVQSGEAMAKMVRKDVKRANLTTCDECGYISSNPLCKACVLLQTLEQGTARLDIGQTEKLKMDNHVMKRLTDVVVEGSPAIDNINAISTTPSANTTALRLRGGHSHDTGDNDTNPVKFYRQTPKIRKAMTVARRSAAAKYVEGPAFIIGLNIALDTKDNESPGLVEENMLKSVCKIVAKMKAPATDENVIFQSLIQETKACAKPSAGPRSPELDRILDQIRHDRERAEYARMTAGFGMGHREMSLSDDLHEWKQVSNQLSVVLNIGVSMFACALAAWSAARASGYGLEIKTTCAMIAAAGIAAIEAFLYLRSEESSSARRPHRGSHAKREKRQEKKDV